MFSKNRLIQLIVTLLIYNRSHLNINAEQCVGTNNIDDNGTCSSSQTEFEEEEECSLYLAPSSVPGAGFGLFVARDVNKEELILHHADAPSIVVCDDPSKEGKVHPWYYWSGGGLVSYECDQASESVMSLGAISNYHTKLKNVVYSVMDYDDAVVDRFTQHEAGAFSYYKGYNFRASRDIIAGEEIFADYGESWLNSRKGTFTDHIPRKADFDNAGDVLNRMRKDFNGKELQDESIAAIKDIVQVFDDRAAALLPNSKKAFEAITDSPDDDKRHFSRILALASVKKRNASWVKENGICMDTIKPGKSTIPHAGQGAFAKRNFSEGDRIAPAPLLQVMKRDSLLMYDELYDEESGESYVLEEPSGVQLLINYCFGHQDSEMLLCPQSNVILMNHCSDRKDWGGACSNKGPNAKAVWANGGWDPNSDSWLKMSLSELDRATENGSRGLSMEIVALRDIKLGEEIFIDYGLNWEEVWKRHSDNWEPPADGSGFEDYIPVKTMNDNSVLKTVDELETDPYPENIVTACFWYPEHTDDGEDSDLDGEDSDLDDEEVDYLYGGDYVSEDGVHYEEQLWYCDILDKTGDETYDVVIPPQPDKEEPTYLYEYPRQSIIFRTKKYSSDQHLPNAFRHYIEIDDNIFPDSWRMNKPAS